MHGRCRVIYNRSEYVNESGLWAPSGNGRERRSRSRRLDSRPRCWKGRLYVVLVEKETGAGERSGLRRGGRTLDVYRHSKFWRTCETIRLIRENWLETRVTKRSQQLSGLSRSRIKQLHKLTLRLSRGLSTSS